MPSPNFSFREREEAPGNTLDIGFLIMLAFTRLKTLAEATRQMAIFVCCVNMTCVRKPVPVRAGRGLVALRPSSRIFLFMEEIRKWN